LPPAPQDLAGDTADLPPAPQDLAGDTADLPPAPEDLARLPRDLNRSPRDVERSPVLPEAQRPLGASRPCEHSTRQLARMYLQPASCA